MIENHIFKRIIWYHMYAKQICSAKPIPYLIETLAFKRLYWTWLNKVWPYNLMKTIICVRVPNSKNNSKQSLVDLEINDFKINPSIKLIMFTSYWSHFKCKNKVWLRSIHVALYLLLVEKYEKLVLASIIIEELWGPYCNMSTLFNKSLQDLVDKEPIKWC